MEILSLSDYSIFVGPAGDGWQRVMNNRAYSRKLILVDDHTGSLCLPLFRKKVALKDSDLTVIRIPAGEKHKNIDTCQLIWKAMLDAEADRRSLLINLGGGVIGDMGGFCAATFKRGIDFIQIPTTLLAQVDASIGGKLGIDFFQVKNSIGLFRNPQAVLIDPDFLHTLPKRQIRSGFAEIIKHSLIADREQWERIRQIDHLDQADWHALLIPSLLIKKRIVEQDPFEKNIRKALNFGHTVGHAVEGLALDSPRPLLHGEAIAIGMICEAYLSHRILGLPAKDLADLSAFILKIFGHSALEPGHFQEYFRLMANDKKNEGGKINFSLICPAGHAVIDQEAGMELLQESFLLYNQLGE